MRINNPYNTCQIKTRLIETIYLKVNKLIYTRIYTLLLHFKKCLKIHLYNSTGLTRVAILLFLQRSKK